MTDRPAIPAPDGPAPNFGPSRQPPAPASTDPQPDLPGCAGLTPSDSPTPLPVASTSPNPADQLLAADPDRLPGYALAPLADADRPPAEYHALSAALGCPDLFLADADPGPDQLRFAAELAAEAVRAGERVLIVTPTSADADAVFTRLTSGPGVLVGRALAAYEHPDRLPAAAAACTARSHRDALLADARTRAAAGIAQAEARLTALRAAGEAVGPARAAAGRLARAAALVRLDAEARQCAADLEAKRKELVAVREHPALAGKRSGVFGRVMGYFSHKSAVADDPDHQAKAIEEEVGQLEAAAARVAAERTRVDETGRAGGSAFEVEDREQAQAEADFLRAALAFAAAGMGELNPTPEAVDRAAAVIPALAAQTEAELAAARRSVAELDGRGPAAALRVLARVRVVVSTFDAVGADPLTLPPAGDGPAFDRLVLTDADRLNETGFAHAARSAARWVLVGDAFGPRVSHRNGRLPRPTLFRRLWAHLHRETWVHEAGRLVAVLTDADPNQLTREPLADRPDVELRFARGADGEPVLAEVAFPPTATAAEAKAFLAGELGEVRLSPCGPVHWHETDDRLTACWPAADAPHADWAELAPGVREKVVGTGPDCRTAAVSFDRDAGWDRESAGRWLADHGGPGARTAALPRPAVIASAPTRLTAGVSG
ncbi:MAG TPA: hypothetical protein VFG68_23365 [Fimbriiglobus sp.]|nr:hypothetical protein [Fimbriiglobus sp.]